MKEEEYYKVYTGEYNNRIIVLSKKKELVINYMENHRGLKPHQYVIKKKELSDTDLLLKYEDQIISEYNGYYLPSIDQTIIDIDGNHLDMELVNTIDQLKHIALLSHDVKKISQEEFDHMIQTIVLLNKIYKKPKLFNQLSKEYNISHSIIYCDMKEYLDRLKQFHELRDMDKQYMYACTN